MAFSTEIPNKKYVSVNGKRMAYVESGQGDPIVFLHGNPTSSYLWRNVMPHLNGLGRLIAPDLIGMGDSEKLDPSLGPGRYTFQGHYSYLCGFLEEIGATENVILVIHDWGSALGFHWAKEHADSVKGIVFMEAIVKPMAWDEFASDYVEVFKAIRSPAGEELILEQNAFIEKILFSAIMRELDDVEKEAYRAPFQTPDERQPTLNWPRSAPIAGEPADIVEIADDYGRWLKTTQIPKLYIDAEPGALAPTCREFARDLPNLKQTKVRGIHFIQEDSPDEIGQATADFVRGIE